MTNTGTANIVSSINLPVVGSKQAPPTHKGNHRTLEHFLLRFEHVCTQSKVTDDEQKCLGLVQYRSASAADTVKSLDSYINKKYDALVKELEWLYDGDRQRHNTTEETQKNLPENGATYPLMGSKLSSDIKVDLSGLQDYWRNWRWLSSEISSGTLGRTVRRCKRISWTKAAWQKPETRSIYSIQYGRRSQGSRTYLQSVTLW